LLREVTLIEAQGRSLREQSLFNRRATNPNSDGKIEMVIPYGRGYAPFDKGIFQAGQVRGRGMVQLPVTYLQTYSSPAGFDQFAYADLCSILKKKMKNPSDGLCHRF
jgi:hypothetical protein